MKYLLLASRQFFSGLNWTRLFFVRLKANHPRLVLLLEIAIIFGLFFAICYERLDPDFGWHLQSGNYFRKFGIPAHDIYTYTARNFAWIDHEWGNDVIISFLYQGGGFFLTALFFAILWTLALFMNAGSMPFIVVWLGTIATLPYAGIRPTIWTILGLACLIRYSAKKRLYPWVFIPLGFLIWANLQGGFIIGLAYLLYLLVKERRLVWLWTFLLSGAVSFINPYGARLYVEIYRTLSDRQLHHQIKEWSSFYLPIISFVYVIIWGAGFWQYFKKRLSKWLSFAWLMLLAALSASRNLPLFVIASLPDFKDFFESLKSRLPKKLGPIRLAIVNAFYFGLIIFCIVISVQNLFHSDNKSTAYPVEAVAYLNQNHCSGNLFNSYDYGGYLIWKLPNTPIYIDGRMPSWKDPAGEKYLNIYFNVISTNLWPSQFKLYNIRCALLENNSAASYLINSLEAVGWRTVTEANNSILLEATRY